jgi:hypothetical protein
LFCIIKEKCNPLQGPLEGVIDLRMLRVIE